MKIFRKSGTIFLFLFCTVILFLSLRGLAGNPSAKDLNTPSWKDNGPFELSPERGKYGLLYSIIEDRSLIFSPDIGRFIAPDVAYAESIGYVSLFPPGVSFILIPGYIIGHFFGFAQIGSTLIIALFAILNIALIRLIAIRMGANPIAAIIGALAFLFGTPAFPYAVTIYQHHISTLAILFSLYLLIRFNNITSLIIVWILCAASVVVDYPNLFMMLPIALLATTKMIFMEKNDHTIKFSFPLLKIFTILSALIPVLLFLWFNAVSYGNPLRISGTLPRAVEVSVDGAPVINKEEAESKQSTSIFNTFKNRNLINGSYILFLSPDRGTVIYAPIMLLGFIGMFFAIKRKTKYASFLIGVIGFNIIVYSMWGDPYGGWAFGPRYLIPSYSILAIFCAIALTQWKKQYVLLIISFIILCYSIGVNTLGAVTSSKNPPKIEAIALEKVTNKKERYTFLRNAELLTEGESKSFVFQTYVKSYFTAWNYYAFVLTLIVSIVIFNYIYFISQTRNRKYEN